MNLYSSFLTYCLQGKELYSVEHNTTTKVINKENPFIICPGLGRSGTSSLGIALAKLNIDCFQIRDCFKDDTIMDTFMQLSKEKLSKIKKQNTNNKSNYFDNWNKKELMVNYEWNKIFQNVYNGCSGTPTNVFLFEILKYYEPNYKVILTIRNDPNQWYQSIMNSVCPHLLALQSFVFQISPHYYKHFKFIEYIYLLFFKIDIKYYKKEEIFMKNQYNEWIIFIKKNIPKDKYLIFNCSDGWDPLCKFLNKNKPNIPFPHANQRKTMQKVTKNAQRISKLIYITLICTFTSIIYGIYRLQE